MKPPEGIEKHAANGWTKNAVHNLKCEGSAHWTSFLIGWNYDVIAGFHMFNIQLGFFVIQWTWGEYNPDKTP